MLMQFLKGHGSENLPFSSTVRVRLMFSNTSKIKCNCAAGTNAEKNTKKNLFDYSWMDNPNAVYVGRPSKWGNRFKVGKVTAWGEVLTLERPLELYQNVAFRKT